MGYNRRAVNLRRASIAVTDHHGGVFPDRLDDLLALPGVGPYTARAVLAFAFEADVGVVDTNVGRVLARVSGRSLTLGEVQRMADQLVPPGSAWVHNQAMLDVGATICRARLPACEGCPFRGGCAWVEAGRPLPDPAFRSGGVSGRQSRFEGSDRQGRGRLVAALREGPVAARDVPAAMGWPGDPDRAARVVAGLVADGLVVVGPEGYRLP